MGDQRAIRGRLRCCAGCSGTAFYFRCLSRRGHGTSTNGWTGAMLALAAIFFPSFLLIAGGAAFLGSSPFGAGLPVRSERRQRRRGRTPVDRVVYPCLDQLDPFSRRFRPWTRCVWTSDVLAMSPVAGCCVHRRWGRSDGPYLTVNEVAFQNHQSRVPLCAACVQPSALFAPHILYPAFMARAKVIFCRGGSSDANRTDTAPERVATKMRQAKYRSVLRTSRSLRSQA
jgi:hypothetical protein